MTTQRIYLDHNASSPLRPEARAAMLAALDHTGNASSIHAEGRRARAIIETAREQVAILVGASPSDLVFTSGATEANNWVLSAGWSRIVAADIEHDSVRAPLAARAERFVRLPVTADGRVDARALPGALAGGAGAGAERGAPALVSVQLANNETGVIQPVAEVAAAARALGATVHTDAVQAAGRIPIDLAALGVDFLSISSHKIGGPLGVGALVVAGDRALAPLLRGGGQERRRRAGTENVAAIAGFGAAAAVAAATLSAEAARLLALRERLERGLAAISPEARVIGAEGPRLPNTSSVAWPSLAAELTVIKLDLAGVAVSAGAACSSGKVGASTTLAAMGIDPATARTAIRISLGWTTTDSDIDAFLARWALLQATHDGRRQAA